jgi:hypothetical protein
VFVAMPTLGMRLIGTSSSESGIGGVRGLATCGRAMRDALHLCVATGGVIRSSGDIVIIRSRDI